MYSPVMNAPYFFEITPKPNNLRQVSYGPVNTKGEKIPVCGYISSASSPVWEKYYKSIATNLRKLGIEKPNLNLIKILLNIK